MHQHEAFSIFGKLDYIKEALRNAEILLKFASESGKEVDEEIRNNVLHARATFHAGLDEQTAAKLLASLSKLSVLVSPVTAESLREFDDVEETVRDAENLLKFASESGKEVDEEIRNNVLHARATFDAGLDEQTAAKLLASLSKLSVLVSPVTPESLRECRETLRHRRPYQIPAIVLAAMVVVYSIASFVASAIADSLRNDITTANALAVKLTAELPPSGTESSLSVTPAVSSGVHRTPVGDQINSGVSQTFALPDTGASASSSLLPSGLSRADVIGDLQKYAISIRNIDSHALELSLYTNPIVRWIHPERIDPFHDIRHDMEKMQGKFELQVPILNYAEAAKDRTKTYQSVRCFAQSMVDQVSFYYGAISSCVLPVLYALLGAVAYLLRNFEQALRERRYVPSPASDSARFLVAAIGGAVVGLFSNVTGGQGVKVPPLAFAFLVGYAVDVFYAFLEGLMQSFTRSVLPSSTKQTITVASGSTPVK